eukprot:CAMPEP_0202958296 /NCGR_PEP_ID=MMETSP1396-20130829/2656_1 /ASSEMBLY_ACC=CAM_ASM_000872 /TAXON_ID= /ORGANISM="Pseudokeronopsis sp., Strain Brazil" /LENGTH=70 /DNA_ID=CAMNT_0049676295 /DNA_START=1621 /DNA_END=1833 /DNA_ORIENTATION=-
MKEEQRAVLLNELRPQKPFKMRAVLSWAQQSSDRNRDLDLFAEFQVGEYWICTVAYYMPLCEGVLANFEG